MTDTRTLSDTDRLYRSLGDLPELVAEPVLIAVSGLPGTGKSCFCARLVERLPALVLESDALRKALFPSPDYSQQESSRLFQAIHRLIERLLKKGASIILDATNLSERHRERLYSIAEHLSVKLILVRVEAPPELVRERLKARQAKPDSASDADWTVYKQMKRNAEKINRNHYVANTSRDITPVLDKIARAATR